MLASSKQAWEPMASSSANFCRKTHTVPPPFQIALHLKPQRRILLHPPMPFVAVSEVVLQVCCLTRLVPVRKVRVGEVLWKTHQVALIALLRRRIGHARVHPLAVARWTCVIEGCLCQGQRSQQPMIGAGSQMPERCDRDIYSTGASFSTKC
jgi:hypothetical protein